MFGLDSILNILLFSCQVVSNSLRSHALLSLPTPLPQAPLSMGFSRQEYWSGLPFPFTWDLTDQGSSPCLLHWQTDS